MSHRRVAIVTGAPAPYREPLFERLARREGVALKVFYCHAGHDDVGWRLESTHGDFDREFLANWAPAHSGRWALFDYLNLDTRRRLAEFRPDYVIVYGHNQIAHWLTFGFCERRRIPFALRNDANVWADESRQFRSQVRRRLVRRLVTKADALLAVGSANREYWLRYGAEGEKIVDAPYAVDNAAIAKASWNRQPDPLGRTRFLYVGRLIERKNVDLLIGAFNAVAPARRATLTIVGDGPLREKLQALQAPAARAATRWLGRLPYAQAIEAYRDADVFVSPCDREPWGLVINEAMAAGLPVIASPKAGAAIDLLASERLPISETECRTGWLLDGLTVAAVRKALEACLDEPRAVAIRGVAASRKIQAWNLDRTVDGFMTAISRARPTAGADAVVGAAR